MRDILLRFTKIRSLALVVVAAFVLLGASECGSSGDDFGEGDDTSRQVSVEDRERTFARAEAAHPVQSQLLINFPMRGALVEFTHRQDMVNHPWYIYIMGMDGTPIGYYVGKTYPQSACNFLSPTERIIDLPDAVWMQVTAPSYDGVMYGGGGSSAACESMFFFDVTTNAMHTFVAPMWMASDQPLNINVPRLGTAGTAPEASPPA
jgi:hypothetical protein